MRGLTAPLVKLAVFATVTVVLTGILAATISNHSTGDTTGYAAVFTDATGLNEGDDVRIAGVRVGNVTAIDVVDRTLAQVSFTLESKRKLPALTTATIKYRNLVGQRYVALGTDVPGGATDVLRPNGTIPVDRTQPALNLTTLFNGFRPLFQALNPKDVNTLAGEIIQVFQGEGATVQDLLTHVASLTTAIADKDQVIGQVIDNLNAVLTTVNAHGPALGQLIDQVQQLNSGLAAERKPVGDAITALGGLTSATAGLLGDTRPELKDDIAQLGALSKNLADNSPMVQQILQTTPGRLQGLTKVGSYGSWFNFFLCRLTGTVSVTSTSQQKLQLPLLPLPTATMPERCGP